MLEIYIDKVCEPLFKMIEALKAPINFDAVIPSVLDLIIKTHKSNRRIHEMLHSLSGTDEAVGAQFIALEDKVTQKIADRLAKSGVVLSHPIEKIHFAMDIVQSFCHEYIFDKHEYIDYDVLKDMVTETLIKLFTE